MSKHTDGGPAFPTPWAAGTATEGGMTMRDWFAGQAMQGMLASANSGGRWDADHDILTGEAYDIADAMLKERKK